MDTRTKDTATFAIYSALKSERLIAARGHGWCRHELRPHEIIAILEDAGVEFYRVEGVVDERQLVLIPKGDAG